MVIVIIKIEKGGFGGEDNIDAAVNVDVTLRSGVLFSLNPRMGCSHKPAHEKRIISQPHRSMAKRP